MPPFLLAALPQSSTFYALLVLAGFVVGIYGHAARMPKVIAFAILLVLLSTILALIASSTVEGLPQGVKGDA